MFRNNPPKNSAKTDFLNGVGKSPIHIIIRGGNP